MNEKARDEAEPRPEDDRGEVPAGAKSRQPDKEPRRGARSFFGRNHFGRSYF